MMRDQSLISVILGFVTATINPCSPRVQLSLFYPLLRDDSSKSTVHACLCRRLGGSLYFADVTGALRFGGLGEADLRFVVSDWPAAENFFLVFDVPVTA